MRFLVPLIALLGAIIPATTAQTSGFHALTRPHRNEKVPAGKKYKVEWKVAEEYEDEKVVISLLGGDTGSTLEPIGTIGGYLLFIHSYTSFTVPEICLCPLPTDVTAT